MVVKKGDSSCAAEVSRLLENNGVLILPCDTIYGIVGPYPSSETRIRAIKGREEGKPFLVLIPSIISLRIFSSERIDKRALDFWPGPLTLVVKAKKPHDEKAPTIALRCPADPFLVEIMARTGLCLFSTSVNRSGHPALWRIHDIEAEFGKEVDLIVDAGDLPGATPSTILDTTLRPYAVIRQGACILPADILGDETR